MKSEKKRPIRGFIRTIGGDISPRDVRYAMCHEHGFLALNNESPEEVERRLPEIEKRMTRDFKNLVSKGVNLFVEVTPAGYSRPVEMWRRVAAMTGMNVVAATGYYAENHIPLAEKRKPVASMARLFVRELVDGIDGTTCRAGVIKVASHGCVLKKAEEKAFIAAAMAYRETGAPITTHSPKAPLAHLDKLAELGVPAEAVALGHVEVSPWEDVLRISARGAMMLFTNFGGEDIVPEDVIIAQIRDMIRRGRLNQILISVDMYLYLKNGRLIHRNRGGYEQLVTRVLSRMTKAGIKPAWIDKMLHENPLRHIYWR